MKRVLLPFLLPALFLFPARNIFSQCNPFFYDGFESGSYTPTWSTASGNFSWSVSTGNTASGTYKLEGTGGTSSHLNGLYTTFAAQTPTNVSWDIYTGGALSTDYVVMGNASVSASACIVFAYWQGSSSNIRFVSSTNIDYPASPNQWYHIEMRNINFSTHTFDVYINNNLVQTGFPFRSSTQNNLSTVHLYNYSNGTGYWDNITIGNSSPLQLSSMVNNVSCNGGSDGSIDLTASSSSPGALSYLWSNGNATEDASALQSGTYSVVVTDGLGCSDSLTGIFVDEPSAIAGIVGAFDPACNGGTDGLASISVTGGTPGYTYSWDNGSTDSTATQLGAGTHTVIVTDANNCAVSFQAVLTDPPAIPLSLDIPEDTICIQYAPFILGGASLPGGTFSGNGVSGNTFDPAIAGLGQAMVTYTYTDSNNCVTTATDQVQVDACLGMKEEDAIPMNIYPNPFGDILNIQSSVLIRRIEWLDMQGKVIRSQNLQSSQATTTTANLPAGVYLLRIISDQTIQLHKVIKQ